MCTALPRSLKGHDTSCHILVEHSARRELDGYNFDALHVVLGAYASSTL